MATTKKTAAKDSASKGEKKIEKVMHEFKEGKLHSGSKTGKIVKNPKQAIAIALSEAREAGAKIPKKSKK
jgi:ribosomal protein L21E